MKTLTVYEPGGDCGWDEAKCEEILADATDDHGAIDASEIVGAIQDVIQNGEYGQMDKDFTGCTVTAEWAVIDGDGEEEDGGTVDIDLLPEEPECAGGDHDWRGADDGFGGAHSLGGTAMGCSSECRRCGMTRYERVSGWQRNPVDAGHTVSYELPEDAYAYADD